MPANVTAIHILKKPLLSEKNTDSMSDHKRYTFLVDPRATKDEIKAAVQEIYKVRVVAVNTQVRKGEEQRTKFGAFQRASTKKATVRLHAEDSIEFF
ncbi:MAG: 50S ribosomal protein L23 [Planctomycetota bacterium]